ncbi:phospholipid methyltransferase-domain-containing protein [Protomyces lactucae-debilis]|uniref:Phosphatidylethanolamine N-methyltransferase n=1 Tax=Protomyces lactucae-debilis TaxID=2754530 RepID=A0A1Y2FBT6_PROLT|nr:phospholipid methyltransferase-domain-containing protein [Protomyces lactucae-debilis]ORY81378.1 phospholipid methyltransferase-domain-containing protein [Protomyces lactucae-debilis]
MVSTILDPRQPKSEWDLFIVGTILAHVGLYFLTSGWLRKALFLALFTFWRLSYNLGIGFVLHQQSNVKQNDMGWLVKKAHDIGIFDASKNPKLYRFVRRQLIDKMGPDFDYEKSPIEYQTWLLFRRGVDLILMLDFCSYVLMAVSWSYVPKSHGIVMHTARWTFGWILVLFNLWVKLDANRVVKDFAWYWGDFFYRLLDSDLTFDGVYELCMHPMYSLGYAGYYGISLLACSYAVLFTSIIAHISQFIFLYTVEEPHIRKTYSPKSTLKIQSKHELKKELMSNERAFGEADSSPRGEGSVERMFDLFRSTDVTQVLIVFIGIVFAVFTPQQGLYARYATAQAVIWRFVHTFGLFWSLNGQSEAKVWTRHFVKYGESPKRAWQEWKNIYLLSLTVMYVTFLSAAYKSYSIPDNWQYSTCLLRHILGIALIAMHIWTSISIHEVLGTFGYFFGDFFVDSAQPRLQYTGVYRYLNNPDRIVYSFWGFALLANSTSVILLAAQAQIINICFITFVEKPHMEKLYGGQLRKEAGFKRSLKSMPVVDHPHVRRTVEQVEGTFDHLFDRAVQSIQDFFTHTRPQLDKAIQESKVRVHRYSNSITITKIADNLNNLDLSQFKLELVPSAAAVAHPEASSLTNVYQLGEPIRVRWQAPLNHARRDWIGVYRVTDNLSKDVTRVASQGHWSAIESKSFGDHQADILEEGDEAGMVEFRADTVPWTEGTYEIRYHHDGKHNVLAISQPFEIAVDPLMRLEETTNPAKDEASAEEVAAVMLSLVQTILRSEKDLDLPISLHAAIVFGDDAEKYAKRIAYAIDKRFGVDLAWQLVATDASVENLAKRVVEAKRVLRPFVRYDARTAGQESALQASDAQKESQWTL